MRALSLTRALTAAAVLVSGLSAAQEEPLPPPPPVPPAYLSLAPAEAPNLRFERFRDLAPQRMKMEALGAAAGMAVGVAGPLALAALTCQTGDDFGCFLPVLLGPPGGLFLPSAGVYLMGASYEGAGGYWLSVAGSATGWMTSLVLWSVIDPQSYPTAGLTALLVGIFPVAGAIAGYELYSLRAVLKNKPISRHGSVSLVPWLSPTGGRGLVLGGSF